MLPSCNTYHLTWFSLTLGMGYLFTAAPAKHSHCSLPWMNQNWNKSQYSTQNITYLDNFNKYLVSQFHVQRIVLGAMRDPKKRKRGVSVHKELTVQLGGVHISNCNRKQTMISSELQAKCHGSLTEREIRESEVSWRWNDLSGP